MPCILEYCGSSYHSTLASLGKIHHCVLLYKNIGNLTPFSHYSAKGQDYTLSHRQFIAHSARLARGRYKALKMQIKWALYITKHKTCVVGTWFLGTCYLGTWYLGTCYLGTWYLGTWYLGTWHLGTWRVWLVN